MVAGISYGDVRRVYVRNQYVRWTGKLVPIGILLVAWELASGRLVTAEILPPFSATAVEIAALGASPEFHEHALHTLFRGLAGIALATVLAVPIGLAMHRNERVRRNLDPIISLTYPVPKSPLIPLVIFWLGMGHASRVTLAVIGSFLPVLISSFNGASNVRQELLWVGRSMGLSRVQETYRVLVPAALPTIMTGVRIGLIFSFVIVISSEMILANTGLGVPVVRYGQYGQYERVFAAVFWIAVVVAGLDRLYLLLSSRLLGWSEQEVGGL